LNNLDKTEVEQN